MLLQLSFMGNSGNMYTSGSFYTGLVEVKSDDNLRESLGFDSNQLANLFVKLSGKNIQIITRKP